MLLSALIWVWLSVFFLIGAIFDLLGTKLQWFELVFITLMYAAAPYVLLEAQQIYVILFFQLI